MKISVHSLPEDANLLVTMTLTQVNKLFGDINSVKDELNTLSVVLFQKLINWNLDNKSHLN